MNSRPRGASNHPGEASQCHRVKEITRLEAASRLGYLQGRPVEETA